MDCKKIFAAAALAAAAAVVPLSSCGAKGPDYASFISEKRTDVYLYEDDDVSLKVYVTERETPYLSDGYKGSTGEVCEIFAKFTSPPQTVTATMGDSGGEMSYMAVTDSYYLSFTGGAPEGGATIELTRDGESADYTAESVLYDGVISCERAPECARQYAGDTFSAPTDGNNFRGDTYVRPLADDGKCYYYVGVIDREGNTKAYLVDGEKGSVIAERDM